jgi:hypothetical protein
MLKSKDRAVKARLDAMIAAYLTLSGPAGVGLIDDLYLKNQAAEYPDIYAAVTALRFHGQEEKAVSRERLLESMRLMLARKQMCEMVIPDLARWQDWSVMEQLVKLYKESDDDSNWIRTPIIQYLRVCPLPAAKTHLEEIAKLNPELMSPARGLFPGGATLTPSVEDKTAPQNEKPARSGEKPASAPQAKPAAPAKKAAASRTNRRFARAKQISVTYTESLELPAFLNALST